MTLSRRDEFAARAMESLIRKGGLAPCYVAEESRKIANELAIQLDRTAPKPEREEIEDDGRMIFDSDGWCVGVHTSLGGILIRADDSLLTPSDARLFAQRIMRAADEAEKAGK